MSLSIPYRAGEVTLWEGRPARGFRYSVLHGVIAGIGLFMLIMTLPVFFLDIDVPDALWARIVLIAGMGYIYLHILLFLFGLPFLDIQHRAMTQYKLTDQRAMIIDSSPISSVFVYDLGTGLRVDHVPRSQSVLISAKQQSKRKVMPIETDHRFTRVGRYFLFFNQLINTAGFRFIDDAASVADLINDAIQAQKETR